MTVSLANKDYFMMGTLIHIEVGGELLSEKDTQKLFKMVEQRLQALESKFTVNCPESQVMAINQQAGMKPVEVDDEVFYVIQKAVQTATEFPSTFNPLIGPLVKLWRIGFKEARVPNQQEIQTRMSLLSLKDIVLNGKAKTVYLARKNMELDLGAIAKGYIADEIKKLLLESGVTTGIINLGGNILVFGESPKQADGYWRVGIQNPFEERGEIVGFFKIKNQSVVTSGIYERKLLVDGKRYHHIFDGKTGYPIETEIASVTLIEKNSIDADLWSSVAYGRTVAESQGMLAEHLGMIVTNTRQIFLSPALKNDFKLLDSRFTIIES